MKKQANPTTLWLYVITSVLIIIGFLFLFSALLGQYNLGSDISITRPLLSQSIAIFIGVVLFFIVKNISVSNLQRFCLFIFIGSVLFSLLVFVPAFSADEAVFRRVLLFGFTFQPTELLKIGAIIMGAAIFASTIKKKTLESPQIISLAILIGVILGLAYFQPDYGTALVILIAITAMAIVTPLRWWWYLLGVAIIVPIAALVINTQEYTQDRIETFFKLFTGNLTSEEVQGSAYQLLQAEKTIGSGGIFGRGFARGAQKFGFLPEVATDQIFSNILEETGFVGGVFIVILFLIFVFVAMRISIRAPNEFAKILGVGLTMLVGAQAFINMMIPLNLFVNTGIPLPFFSKGGSIIIGTMIIIGILSSISESAPRPLRRG